MQAKIFNTLAAEYLCSVTYVYFKNIFGLKDLDIFFVSELGGKKRQILTSFAALKINQPTNEQGS